MNRHFILTNLRSGSNFLTSTINKHPELLNYGEVLGEWTLPRRVISRRMFPRMSDEEYLDFIYGSRWAFYGGQIYSAMRRAGRQKPFTLKARSRVKSVGLKDMAFLVRQRDLARYLAGSNDIKIIHLVRTNTLKRFVSFERMRRTRVVSSERAEASVLLEINLGNVVDRLRVFQREDLFAAELVRGLPAHRVMVVRYEKYFFDAGCMKETNDALFRFLGVKPLDIIAEQRKISPDNLRHIVGNYSELQRVLSGTEFERFLE